VAAKFAKTCIILQSSLSKASVLPCAITQMVPRVSSACQGSRRPSVTTGAWTGASHQGQGRSHDGDDDGRAGVALTAVAMGRMLEVFMGLFEFFAHGDRASSSLT
jgi:hypothetical protein